VDASDVQTGFTVVATSTIRRGVRFVRLSMNLDGYAFRGAVTTFTNTVSVLTAVSTGWPQLHSGPVKIASTLRMCLQHGQVKGRPPALPLCGIAPEGSIVYGRTRIRHRQHGYVAECNFMKGRVHGDDWRHQCARIRHRSHAVAGWCDTGSQPVASCDVKH
jgi:hypothetical protein